MKVVEEILLYKFYIYVLLEISTGKEKNENFFRVVAREQANTWYCGIRGATGSMKHLPTKM